MNVSRLVLCALLAGGGLAACSFSGDSLPPSADSVGVRSFVVDRQLVERISYQGSSYDVQDITFEYADGRRETRRYVIIGMRRVGCGGEDCQDALVRGLADANEGDDDY